MNIKVLITALSVFFSISSYSQIERPFENLLGDNDLLILEISKMRNLDHYNEMGKIDLELKIQDIVTKNNEETVPGRENLKHFAKTQKSIIFGIKGKLLRSLKEPRTDSTAGFHLSIKKEEAVWPLQTIRINSYEIEKYLESNKNENALFANYSEIFREGHIYGPKNDFILKMRVIKATDIKIYQNVFKTKI